MGSSAQPRRIIIRQFDVALHFLRDFHGPPPSTNKDHTIRGVRWFAKTCQINQRHLGPTGWHDTRKIDRYLRQVCGPMENGGNVPVISSLRGQNVKSDVTVSIFATIENDLHNTEGLTVLLVPVVD